jgi:hypothetical protein
MLEPIGRNVFPGNLLERQLNRDYRSRRGVGILLNSALLLISCNLNCSVHPVDFAS